MKCLRSLSVLSVCGFAAGAGAQPTQFHELFKAPVFIEVGVNPVDVVAMDLNGDDHADILAANGGGTTKSIRVLMSDGSGGFTSTSITHTNLIDPRKIALRDLDNDGLPDLAIANGSGQNILVFPGEAGGGFEEQPITSEVGVTIRDLDFGLIDGDNLLDAITANQTSSDGVAYLNALGSGGFDTPDFFTNETGVRARLADFDGDSRLDFIVQTGDDGSVDFYLGSSSNIFTRSGIKWIPTFPTGNYDLRSITVGDVGGLPKPDVLLVMHDASLNDNDHIAVLSNISGVLQSGLDFDDPEFQFVANSPRFVAMGEVDQALTTQDRDLIVTHSADDSIDVSVLLYAGQGLYESPLEFAFDSGLSPSALTLADVDGDGDLDLITAVRTDATPTTNGHVAIFENLAINNLGDLNGDGFVDGADLAILLTNWGACSSSPCPGDFNGDEMVDGVDLAILLTNWTDPPALMATSESNLGGFDVLPEQNSEPQATESGTPWIVAHFGFTTTSEYLSWIDQLSEPALMEHFEDVINLLLSE